MNRRVFSGMVGFAVGLPAAALQLALLFRDHSSAQDSWLQLCVANLALVFAVAALAADFPPAGRAGRAALIGLGTALVMPGPTALDAVVMQWDPALDGAGVVAALPYVLLLAMLACAEAGLYLLATRPRIAR
jgi:hypothetical protein